VIELDPSEKARLGAERWKEIEAGAHERARTGFQYRYQALRVPDDDELEGCDDPLTEFARLMQSDAMLDLLKAITGHVGVAFTDGQATAYGHGDFLTCHDDDVPGKNRIAAYVYGLTPGWRLEWGGLLLFHGEADRTAEALVPRFNTLDLFSVPRRHSVSVVTPSAAHRRFAVTGWLRGGAA
jgi:Rps23 Pro-64 3,4-dihydroxylase Tpa1-like proline 4-hydroxylase